MITLFVITVSNFCNIAHLYLPVLFGSLQILKPVLILLKELGARLMAYTDNVLVLAEMAERAMDHMDGLIYLLENLGFLY